jgi:hypothetical protein
VTRAHSKSRRTASFDAIADGAPVARKLVAEAEMTWSEGPKDTNELVRELSRCIDACRASELYCTLAVDVASTMDDDAYGARGATVLRACAMLCNATATAIARMRTPDLDIVADALLACRVACRAARSECRRRPFDACCTECAESCGECATLCESLLAHTALAAA